MSDNGVPSVRDRLIERRQAERLSGIDFGEVKWIDRRSDHPIIKLLPRDNGFIVKINAATVALLRQSGKRFARIGLTDANGRPALVIDPVEQRTPSTVAIGTQGVIGGSWFGEALYRAGWAAGDYAVESLGPHYVVRGAKRAEQNGRTA